MMPQCFRNLIQLLFQSADSLCWGSTDIIEAVKKGVSKLSVAKMIKRAQKSF